MLGENGTTKKYVFYVSSDIVALATLQKGDNTIQIRESFLFTFSVFIERDANVDIGRYFDLYFMFAQDGIEIEYPT